MPCANRGSVEIENIQAELEISTHMSDWMCWKQLIAVQTQLLVALQLMQSEFYPMDASHSKCCSPRQLVNLRSKNDRVKNREIDVNAPQIDVKEP